MYLNGRSRESIEGVASGLRERGFKEGEQFQGIVADISTKEGCQSFFEQVTGDIDVVVNNMGVFSVVDFFEVDDEGWLDYYQKNVLSTVRFCRHYLKPMLERGRGRIINVSSEAGLRPIPHMIPYSVSKGSQIVLTRGLAELTKGTAVTVNSLLPGPTYTEGVAKYLQEVAAKDGVSVEEATTQYFITNEPTSLIRRFLTVLEVANVACFLASDLASGINGAAQKVEGGIIRSI